ncbi:SNF2 family N-terminal domain containing protein [Rhypophila decipiens]
MPDLASLSLSASSDVSPADVLDDVSKARLMRVFDLASDHTAVVEVKPSPRLKTTLKSVGTNSRRMTGRECEVVDNARFPTLWEKSMRPNCNPWLLNYFSVSPSLIDGPRAHRGGILADEMGLGKTLSTLALLCWSLDSSSLDDDVCGMNSCRQTLVVTPKSTLPGWQEQIRQYVKKGQLKTTVFHGSNRGKQAEKLDTCDVVFTTYQTLRSDWSGDQLLYSKPWARVVLDEAHHIRTRSTDLFKAACSLEAPFRWCLTGTPIHNSLDDYASLVSFIGVEPFASKSAFDRWIAAPLKHHGKENLRNLEHLVKATCLRRTKKQLVRQGPSLYLPARTEKVEWIDLSPADRDIYEFFKARTAKIASGMMNDTGNPVGTKDRGQNVICLIDFLRLICGHGEGLLPSSALEIWKSRDSEAIDWEMMKTMSGEENWCRRCGGQRRETPSEEVDNESLEGEGTGCVCGAMNNPLGLLKGIGASNKVRALVRNIREEQQVDGQVNAATTKRKLTGLGSVVFSCWTKMLDLVQQTLINEGFVAVRIDGQKSLKERTNALSTFRSDPACTVMLASIGSAGEGVDFTSATCAVDRVHRIGQHRPITTTRYVTRNSIETYVQWIQKSKIKVIYQSLSGGLDGEPRERLEDQRWKVSRPIFKV